MKNGAWPGRSLWAEVDLDALAHNLRQLKERLGRAKLLAVVKANAYGHGAVPVAEAALEAGADFLGVACTDEGVQLRKAGIAAPILIMGSASPQEAQPLVEHRLTPTVTTRQLALALASLASQKGILLAVHLKVDTGMRRFGLAPEEVAPFASFLQELPGLTLEGVYTHFATADEADKDFTRQQLRIFNQVTADLPAVAYRHVANSAAVLDMPETCLDMARLGISIYGIYPSPSVDHTVLLKPVLSLKARLARVFPVASGEGVSYGLTWTASRPSRLALVPCGYADGLPRSLSNRGTVLLQGQRAPIVGRVCMDQCLVDVTDIPGVALDDEAVIIGRQGEDEMGVDEIAELAGTITYEILCGISARVPRVYIRGGDIMRVETLVENKTFSPS